MAEQRAWRSQQDGLVAVVSGASGGIGAAVAEAIVQRYRLQRLYLVSRSPVPAHGPDERVRHVCADLLEPGATAQLAQQISAEAGRIDLLFNCCGLLHDASLKPEKTVAAIDADALARLFAVNATLPMLLARDLGPLLRRSGDAVFASVSARVGSIGDNRAGGWYGYRASKAAHNMLMRTLALEWRVSHPRALCVMLQPGTVATRLSQPFVGKRAAAELLTPAQSAASLLAITGDLRPEQSGSFLDWRGASVPW